MKKSDLIKLLMGLGYSKAEADKIAKSTPDDASIAAVEEKEITDLIAVNREKQKELLENDTEFVGAIQTAEKGKQLDIVTRKLKSTFGLDAAAIKGKEIEEVIALAKTKVTEGATKTEQELQNEVITLTNKVKEYEEVIIPKTKQEVELEKEQFWSDNELTKFLAGQKLRNPMEAVFTSVKANLLSMYDIKKDDKGKPVLYNKGTQTKPTKADKTGLLTFEEVLTTKLEELQFIEKSNGKPGTTQTHIQPVVTKTGNEGGGDNTPKFNNPHMDKAKAHLESLKTDKPA